jgi:hypothetical protein
MSLQRAAAVGESPGASCGVTAPSARPISSTNASRVRAVAFLSDAFTFEKASSIGEKKSGE